jgi:hypothetical protein
MIVRCGEYFVECRALGPEQCRALLRRGRVVVAALVLGGLVVGVERLRWHAA